MANYSKFTFNMNSSNIKKSSLILLFSLPFLAILLGVSSGVAIGKAKNISSYSRFDATVLAQPSQLYDRNGILIKEFFDEEKRELIDYVELPENLPKALITREDEEFFFHPGVSLKHFFLAVAGIIQNTITGGSSGSARGGSTLTMQYAGWRFLDRNDRTATRKLAEWWWSVMTEKYMTKYEILEAYMNQFYFGSGQYGVESSSRFYFGHSVRENTPAESATLVSLLSSPVYNDPIRYPKKANLLQSQTLNKMVVNGFITQEEADFYFQEFWANYDWTQSSNYTSVESRGDDLAPWFSEYVRILMGDLLFGRQNIYRDGFQIFTTLDLEKQYEADREVRKGIVNWNEQFQKRFEIQQKSVDPTVPLLVDMLAMRFNLDDLHVGTSYAKKELLNTYNQSVNAPLSLIGMAFDLTDINDALEKGISKSKQYKERTTVESALVTIDNKTGHILALVGGSKFAKDNQFNRAVSLRAQLGSSFKPLFISAGISSGAVTPGSGYYDAPTSFPNPSGDYYTPGNYGGTWRGWVTTRTAVALSLNIPSLIMLGDIGFESAIQRSADLLGVTDPAEIYERFPRVYPLALGTTTGSPLEMARAYSTFANEGRPANPLAIRYVEDRNGNIIINLEQENLIQINSKENQLMTPQAAYLMTNLLMSTTDMGTLYYPLASSVGEGHKGFMDRIRYAGKTGTTQNWTDGWIAGYTPYYTTVMWVGFDSLGNSLGTNMSGSQALGAYWSRYMRAIHKGLPSAEFAMPETGIVSASINRFNGKLYSEYTPAGSARGEIFLEGHLPSEYDKTLLEEQTVETHTLDKITDFVPGGSIGEDFSNESSSLADPLGILGSSDAIFEDEPEDIIIPPEDPSLLGDLLEEDSLLN